jgi:hypothetical protein
MATKERFVQHLFAGGWATDFGVTASVPFEDVVQIPYLIDAENVLYELNGGPHKMPGTSLLGVVDDVDQPANPMKGLFDFWVTGTAGAPTQHRVGHVDTLIFRDDADGTFTSLFTGLEAGRVPSYAVLEDVLVIASDSTSDVPRSWDGSTAQNLAGSPPNFAFSEAHKNRMWASGDVTNPSRLYYSALLDPEDWTGSGSGSIDIDPSDGDSITGIASHLNELWVFKGPYKGSIHRIVGSSPTGDDAFARVTFTNGVGAVGHNTIFRFGNDLGFMWSDGSIRSLSATEKFGDFSEAALSRPINIGFIDARVNLSRLKHAWAAVDDIRGVAVFAIPIDAATNPNAVIAMDYRFAPPRWSFLSDFDEVTAMASVVDQTNNGRRIILMGGKQVDTSPAVHKWGQPTRSLDGTAISFKVTTPHMNYGLPAHMKTITAASLGLAPKSDDTVTFGWQRDNFAQQTETVTQGGGGAALDSFILDTDVLGGASFVDRFMELVEGDEFRSVRYQVTHSANNADLELHSIGALLKLPGPISLEN